MTNKDALISLCDAEGIDLDILSYQEIVEDYVCGLGLETVEDFCGHDMSEDETAYWIVDSEPYFAFVKNGEDISNDEVERILLYIDIDIETFEKYKNK